ncbi:hypothetical protein HYC88_21370 [Streptomyces sp. CB00271]|nr:hypothetical protein HYC88_21370 [Streptomyces sp. CB00271]
MLLALPVLIPRALFADKVSVSTGCMTTLTQRPLPAVGPDGVNPSRARPAVRALYTRPALTAGDLSAPLLSLPDGHPGAGRLPGAVQLSDVRRTVARWRGLGIGGVKAFALGHDRDNAGSTAVSSGNLMVQVVSAIREVTPDLAVTTGARQLRRAASRPRLRRLPPRKVPPPGRPHRIAGAGRPVRRRRPVAAAHLAQRPPGTRRRLPRTSARAVQHAWNCRDMGIRASHRNPYLTVYRE